MASHPPCLSALRARRAVSAALVALLLLGGLSGCRLSKNFYEVDPGQIYRSAQLTGEEFDEAIAEHGLKTILNLRGAHPDEAWYVAEKAAAERHGVKLIDIPMRADLLPQRAHLIALLDAYRDAERPILVHCKAGADRTGEAIAIYMLDHQGRPKAEALEALDFDYWHVEAFKPAKCYFIREVYQGEAWAREAYDPCAPAQDYEYFDKAKACHAGKPVVRTE